MSEGAEIVANGKIQMLVALSGAGSGDAELVVLGFWRVFSNPLPFTSQDRNPFLGNWIHSLAENEGCRL